MAHRRSACPTSTGAWHPTPIGETAWAATVEGSTGRWQAAFEVRRGEVLAVYAIDANAILADRYLPGLLAVALGAATPIEALPEGERPAG